MKRVRYFAVVLLVLTGLGSMVHGQSSAGRDTTGSRVDFWETPKIEAPRRDTAAADAKKLKLVKRSFEYREQVGIALGMMGFVLLMMTSASQWNPR